jgi:hypothetical protein
VCWCNPVSSGMTVYDLCQLAWFWSSPIFQFSYKDIDAQWRWTRNTLGRT